MNLKDNKYAQYYLVQEMMGTVDTVRKFNPTCSQFVADAVKATGRLLFSGEGSSRIMPSKNASRKAKRWGLEDSDGTAQSVTKAMTGRSTNDTCVRSKVER